MEAAIDPRHVACAGVFNIRDLGGYATTDGRQTPWRTLYRADGLHRVTPAAGARLADLGWRTVLDLRTVAERDRGAYDHPGAEVIHLPVLRETWDITSIADGYDAVEFLVQRYVEMLDEGAGAFAAAVEILAAPERRPAVFHCAAGKDRTGVLAALVLAVLGVPDLTIAEDYALSTAAMDELVVWYREERPEVVEQMAQQPAHLLACPPEAMLAFLAHLRLEHGSVRQYLVDAGTAPQALDDLSRIRER